MSRKVTAYIGLGSNIGDRTLQLKQAVDLLHRTNGICVKRISSIYETAPVGYLDQSPFYNCVIEIQTILSPTLLLATAMQIEKKMHRVRKIHWGPRTIDIDILLYENRTIDQEELQIPHCRMTERAFVLVPMRELTGNILIPGTDKYLDECIGQLPVDQEIHILHPVP